MRNLADNNYADMWCRSELVVAGIDVVALPKPRDVDFVRTRITGKIGDITLTRAGCYWVAKGKVPLDVARRLYADPIGRRDVRVNGDCTYPAPGEPGGWIEWFDGDEPVCVDPDGTEEAAFDSLIKIGLLRAEDKPRFVKSNEELAGYITVYHIDSAEGLALFAREVKP